MSRTITIDLSDEEFAQLEREASAAGRTPAEVIRQRLRAESAALADGPRPASQSLKEDVEAAMLSVARDIAARTGQTPEEALDEWRARLRASLSREITDDDRRQGLEQLRPFFGSVDSGDPHGADNERIDADLVREYERGLDRDE
jgi:hypothetical protein